MKIKITDINGKEHFHDVINEDDIAFQNDSGKFINHYIIKNDGDILETFIEQHIDYTSLSLCDGCY